MKKMIVMPALIACLLLTACSAPVTAPTAAPTETTVASESVSDNPLIAAGIMDGFILNGSQNKVLGKYAKVYIDKADLKEISLEQYSEFCEAVLKPYLYGWTTIMCKDGTGIQFVGSQSAIATYGRVDYEGKILDAYGDIIQTADGFVYEKIVYPEGIAKSYVDIALPPQDVVYETTGSENGLVGTVNLIDGVIESIDHNFYDDAFGGYYCDDAFIKTDKGMVMVGNLYKSLYDRMVQIHGIDTVRSAYPDSPETFVFPKAGSEIHLIAVYIGYSQTREMPVFYYGACESMYRLFELENPAIANPSGTEAIEKG